MHRLKALRSELYEKQIELIRRKDELVCLHKAYYGKVSEIRYIRQYIIYLEQTIDNFKEIKENG